MKNLLKFIFFLVASAAFGIYSAQFLYSNANSLLARTSGVWSSWTPAGASAVDPYTRAHFLTRGKLPLSRFEAIEFEATRSQDGEPFEQECAYRLEGKMPLVRWWSLGAYSGSGQPVEAALPDAAVTSEDVVYEADGSIKIVVSRTPAAGNWLRPPAEDGYRLILRLYNPASVVGSNGYAGALLSVARGACR